MVVYGHTPVPEPVWLNGTIDIDTGCVFGGKLTALRYPERELVSVPAQKVYCEPVKPLIPASTLTIQQQDDDVLDIADVTGKRRISTKLQPNITIRAENAVAALEVLCLFKHYENMHSQYQSGLIDKETWRAWSVHLRIDRKSVV